MTKLITTPLGGAESLAIIKTRLQSITDGCFGTGAYAGAANWGGVRALLNPMLPAAIANREAVGSYIAKLNILNNPVSRLVSAIFTGANDVLFDFTDPVGNFADTAGTVQITHNTPLARANSLVNAVNSQQATSSLRGLWMADNTGGWYRPDQTDDLFAFTLPNAVTGTVCLIGRGGCYFETRDAGLGATVNVGWSGTTVKNGTYGGWNALAMCGDILAIGFREGTLTTDQRLHIARAFRPFGGAGIWAAGAEMFADPAFDTGTGWTFGTGWSYDAGNKLASRPAGGSSGIVRAAPAALTNGAWYKAQADVAVTAAGTSRLQLQTVAASSALGPTLAAGTRTVCVFLQAVTGNDGAGIAGNSGTNMTADNFSLKPMTKGW